MDVIPTEYVYYALGGSVVPTLFWLWFWSRRDRFCPEPKMHLFGAFVFGALAALFTLPTQSLIATLFGIGSTIALVLFVSTEEIFKYICCWYNTMRNNPYYNERIDPIIYLATSALGFSVLENTLYFVRYLNDFPLDAAVLQGGQRIIGATVLHMVTATIVGVCISAVFFKSQIARAVAAVVGLVLAIVVHIGFNHLVSHTNPDYVLVAFAGTWFLFMLVLIVIEMLRSPTCPPDIDWINYEEA